MRSAPQKQPRATTICSVPAGKGGMSRAPLTKCASGTAILVARPGSASSDLTSESSFLKPSMEILLGAPGAPLDDLLVPQCLNARGRVAVLGQYLVRVLPPQRRGP